MKKFYLYFSIFCIHVFIAMVAFLHFRLHPGEVLFANYGDGLKNIFTLTTYVKEPITNQGIFKYNTMFYPFGDYVYYTDNVPLFSIPFRWFCHYVYDCSGQTVLIFYICIILNIILSGLLVYYIFRKLVGNNIISYLMALVIPWVNTQILRIQAGHSSFSFSSWILLAIVLMILWHKKRDNEKKQAILVAWMCLLSFLSFLSQGYYLAIITLFQFFMLFFYGFFYRKERVGKFAMLMSGAYVIITLSMAIVLLATTDKYLPLRRENANGYDWMEMKTRISALFSHYSFQQIYFPVTTHSSDRRTRTCGLSWQCRVIRSFDIWGYYGLLEGFPA